MLNAKQSYQPGTERSPHKERMTEQCSSPPGTQDTETKGPETGTPLEGTSPMTCFFQLGPTVQWPIQL